MGCRDCPRCSEAILFTLAFLPFRLAWSLMTGWNLGLLRRKCPHCHHWLSIHQKIAGRYVD